MADSGASRTEGKMADSNVDDMPTDVSETTERGLTAEGGAASEEDVKMSAAEEEDEVSAEGGRTADAGDGDDSGGGGYRLPPGVDDPLLAEPPSVVRDGDYALLHFGDGRRIFAHCVSSWRGKNPPVKINKRSYPTSNLIGLPYGTVLEVGRGELVPLPEGEDVVPDASEVLTGRGSGRSSPVPLPPAFSSGGGEGAAATSAGASTTGMSTAGMSTTGMSTTGMSTDESADPGGGGGSAARQQQQPTDNRHLVDDNTAQPMNQDDIAELRDKGLHGSDIVAKLIGSSATFDGKTEFSKAKYIARKQMKYQPRCRMVRCTAATVCEAWFRKDPKKIMNLREDSLAQILGYSNVCAGSQVLVFEQTMGIITGALAQRLGGYGRVISLFTARQTSYMDMLSRYNLSFAESYSVKWVHAGEVFADDADRPVAPKAAAQVAASATDGDAKADGDGEPNAATEGTEAAAAAAAEADPVDYELEDRKLLRWPCPLQPHTRAHLENMSTDRERAAFLSKRCARFARKLTRHTVLEARSWLYERPDRPCDSLVLATKYHPTPTLLKLLPFLAPSCPFVVFSEFIEPLTECFREVQRRNLAINLRLSDTWMREYQILPGRTHPNMSISQSGGFILTGVKLCPVTGRQREPEAKGSSEKQGGGKGWQRRRQKQRDGLRGGKKRQAGDRDGERGKKQAKVDS